MTDDVETRRRRALYRAIHRGTKEMDHLMGRYAQARLSDMTADDLGHFERFMALPDPMLQNWFLESASDVPQTGSGVPQEFGALLRDMRRFHGLEDLG